MLAVTTQVAEMSLDLSADLLVSEYAPIPSLIQRLGRLNRFHDCPEECKEGVFIEPESILPYDEEQLTGLAEWFDSVADGFPKSQRDLANAFVDLSLDSKEPIQRAYPCDWLERPQDSGTDRKHIEESGFTIEIIREEELGTASPVEIVIPMPMPKSFDILSCKRQGRFFISPKGSMEYDSFKGAQWKQ
jgi:CRISPR-associated endonuclease/helicase Cas3